MKLKILVFAVFCSLNSVTLFAQSAGQVSIATGLIKQDDNLRKVYILPYEPKKVNSPAKKEPTRIEVKNQNTSARKEEDELSQYYGIISGTASMTGLIVLDVFLGSIGISAYYINHSYGLLLFVIGITIGYLCSYSTFVRKRAIAEHIKVVDEMAGSSAPRHSSL